MRFQDKVREFVVSTFGLELADNVQERCHRFAEESIELLQSCGYTKEQMKNMLDYVYNREVGEPKKEVGGVMTTLAALCSVFNVDLIKEAGNEVKRIFRNAQYIRLKHNGKPESIKAVSKVEYIKQESNEIN